MPSKKGKSGKYSKAMLKGMDAAMASEKKKKKNIEEQYYRSYNAKVRPTRSTTTGRFKSSSDTYTGLRGQYESSIKYGGKPISSQTATPERKTAGEGLNVAPRVSAPMPMSGGTDSANDCANPDCRQCKEQRRRERIELPKYYTGLRVSVSGIEPRRKTATILNLSENLPKGHLAVCFDKPVDPDAAHHEMEELAKPGYGMFVPRESVRILEDQTSFKTFQQVPSHVGVVVIEDTKVNSVIFEAGQTGRIIMQPHGADARVMVNWNFSDRHFYDGSRSDDSYNQGMTRGDYLTCYNVPRSMLALCHLDSKNRVLAIWPNSGEQADDTPWKKGDFLRILVAEPQRVTNGERNYRISPGTIMRYQGQVDRHKSQVVLAGGCDPAILGLPTIVSTKGLEKLEEEFIDVGGEVEITATISFRRQDLKGKRAVVILPLDQDGEVGLQFKEDIKAGSLDGYGDDKRCLYIHHSAVKRVSG